MKFSVIGLFGLLFFGSPESAAQKKAASHSISLNNLSEFDPTTSNWKLARAVRFSPTTDENTFDPGKGIVLDLPVKPDTGHLFTKMQHGDLELEFDFAIARKSNSGVYFQGRYEIQLFDSWGVAIPAFYDCGGIYQRWDEKRAPKKGFEGKAPDRNASKEPGAWQHFRIVFRAPRFDKNGRKTENARFVRVVLNDVVIHENAEVTGPTRSAAFDDERPLGPLMFRATTAPWPSGTSGIPGYPKSEPELFESNGCKLRVNYEYLVFVIPTPGGIFARCKKHSRAKIPPGVGMTKNPFTTTCQ